MQQSSSSSWISLVGGRVATLVRRTMGVQPSGSVQSRAERTSEWQQLELICLPHFLVCTTCPAAWLA